MAHFSSPLGLYHMDTIQQEKPSEPFIVIFFKRKNAIQLWLNGYYGSILLVCLAAVIVSWFSFVVYQSSSGESLSLHLLHYL